MEFLRACVHAGLALIDTTPDYCEFLPRVPGNFPGMGSCALTPLQTIP